VVVTGMQSMAGTTRQEPRLGLSWSDIAIFDQHASRQPSPRPREREHLAQTAMIAGDARDHQAKYRNSCRVITASPPMGHLYGAVGADQAGQNGATSHRF